MRKMWMLALLMVCGLLSASSLGEPGTTTSTTRPTTQLASGLIIETLNPGDATAEIGDRVWVHFEGRLPDGKVFESSYRDEDPIDVRLGDDRLIAGWTEGIQGMRVGEKRRLVVPPALGYGDRDHGPIPGKTTLTFDIELVGLLKQETNPAR